MVGHLRGHSGPDGFGDLGCIAGILDLEADQVGLVDEGEGLLGGLFVASEDLAGVQAHTDKVFGVAEELSSEGDGEVGGVSALILLHFAGQHQHFGGGVLHFELGGGSGTSLRMVAASEVTKVLSMWLTTIFLRAAW